MVVQGCRQFWFDPHTPPQKRFQRGTLREGVHRSLSFVMRQSISLTNRSYPVTNRSANPRSTTSARTLLVADEERECIDCSRVARRQQLKVPVASKAIRCEAGCKPEGNRVPACSGSRPQFALQMSAPPFCCAPGPVARCRACAGIARKLPRRVARYARGRDEAAGSNESIRSSVSFRAPAAYRAGRKLRYVPGAGAFRSGGGRD